MKTEEKKEVEVRGESPASRLCDMIIGWANWVAESEEDHQVTAVELNDLYSEAATTLIALYGPEEEEARVSQFLEDRVKPLLLRKS